MEGCFWKDGDGTLDEKQNQAGKEAEEKVVAEIFLQSPS
jgi:hypothetical protein